ALDVWGAVRVRARVLDGMLRDPVATQVRLYVRSSLSRRRRRTWFRKRILLLALGCIFCPSSHAQDQTCSVVPVGQEFWIRLTEPVSTYSSKQGAAVQAILIESPRCDGLPVFSAGTAVQGRITRVRKVGMGFWH